jgi:hypothetical protein
MKKLSLIFALTGACYAQECGIDNVREPAVRLDTAIEIQFIRPVQVEQVSTAYSSLMDSYYKNLWSEPSQPQVIVIQK